MQKRCVKCLLFIYVLVSFIETKAQIGKQKIDSLLMKIAAQTVYEEDAYEDLASIIARSNPTQALELYDYAISKDSSELTRIYLYKGYGRNLGKSGKVDESLQYRYNGLELAKKLNLEEVQLYYHISIANAFLFKNKPDSSTYHLNIAEPLAEKDKNRGWLWNVYYNRGMVQEMIGNIDEMAYYYRLMWEVSKDFPNNSKKRFVLYILADFFTKYQFSEEQTKYLELLAEHYSDPSIQIPRGHIPITDILKGQINPDNVSKYRDVVKISDSLNRINSFSYATMTLADIYSLIGEHKEGIKYLRTAAKKLDTLQKPQLLMDIYKKLVENFEDIGDYKNAFEYKVAELELRDKVTSNEMKKNIAELEVKFETEKKDREIAQQALQIEQKENQKSQLLGGIFGLVLLLLVSGFFFWKRLQYQKTITIQTQELQEQKITELQQQNKLLALNSMIEGQEAERMRIATDLHDSLGGLLSTVKAHFSAIQNEIKQLEKLNITDRTNELIDEACVEVRRISHNMIPHALTISGLPVALEDMAESLRTEGYGVDLSIQDFPDSMIKTKQTMLFRLIQEVVSNFRKHAEAKNILIQLLNVNKGLSLIVEDDGKGFDYEDALASGGVGLKSINSRVEFLDGTIDWDTARGIGTTLTINIPEI